MGNQVAIDIGPVYIRVAVSMSKESVDSSFCDNSFEIDSQIFYFFKITKQDYKSFSDFPIYKEINHDTQKAVKITGMRYDGIHELLAEYYNFQFCSIVTHQCIIRALDFFNSHMTSSFFYYGGNSTRINLIHRGQPEETSKFRIYASVYPCLVVNIRSGISIYKANSSDSYCKVSGTSLGSSTFWALINLCTSYQTPDEAIREATLGNNEEADLTVGDIYGCSYSNIGLSSDIIASSCAKLSRKNASERDIARSILVMFVHNLTQIAYMVSKIEQVENIIIIGNAVSPALFMHQAQESINFWSKGTARLIFSEYGAYMGALGALLLN